jgi:hypothetical protein
MDGAESVATYGVKTVEKILSGFPPKKPATAKEKKAIEEKKKIDAEENERLKAIPKMMPND